MAYMTQENKAKLSPAIKAVLKKYNLKGSISVSNHYTLCVNIKSGEIDFIAQAQKASNEQNAQDGRETYIVSYVQVNEYHLSSTFSGKALECLEKLKAAMMAGNHNNRDVQTDYFDVGWYVSISIGKWDCPYVYTGEQK